MAPGSHLITNDDAACWRVISSLVHALTRYVPLVVDTLIRMWFHSQTQASHVVGLGRVEASDGRWPIGVDDLVVSQEDVDG